MKYVSPLTDGEISVLNDIRKNDPCPRVRDRAHCILLSGRGYKIDEIADIFGWTEGQCPLKCEIIFLQEKFQGT